MPLSIEGSNKTRIIVADDHFVVRRGLKQILAEHFGEIDFGEASDGHEAVKLVWDAPWDVVVLDIHMPGRGGLDALKEIKRARPSLPVIILSMAPEDQLAVRVLKLGASAYLRKESAGHELVAAVEAAIKGQPYITPSLAARLALNLQDTTGGLPHEKLADREFQVFCLLGSGLTAKEAAGKLSLSIKTVSTYRVRALKKMGLKNNSQIIRYVLENSLNVNDRNHVT